MEKIVFTDREKEVIKLLTTGESNAYIAGVLGIGVQCVKWHISNILNKTGCKNRTQIALKYGR